MDKLVKIIAGMAALLLLLSSSGVLKKNQPVDSAKLPDAGAPEKKESVSSPGTSGPSSRPPLAQPSAASAALITSTTFLSKKSSSRFAVDAVRVTYYVLAKSDRCAVDSLSTCLQEKIRQSSINDEDFQYTFFLDQVILEGSGILEWKGREYAVTYDKLRNNGWTPERGGVKNNYTCSNFSYTSKQAPDFIKSNISNKDLFVPMEEARHPNGLTASGQPAIDWQTVSVNPSDFPLSVPDVRRRDVLAERYAANGQKKPAPRSYVLLEFPSGEKFLTEAADTGSGVPQKSIDWRIGNTAAEIAYKQSLGQEAKATCYVFDDPTITFEMALEQSRNDIIKE